MWECRFWIFPKVFANRKVIIPVFLTAMQPTLDGISMNLNCQRIKNETRLCLRSERDPCEILFSYHWRQNGLLTLNFVGKKNKYCSWFKGSCYQCNHFCHQIQVLYLVHIFVASFQISRNRSMLIYHYCVVDLSTRESIQIRTVFVALTDKTSYTSIHLLNLKISHADHWILSGAVTFGLEILPDV